MVDNCGVAAYKCNHPILLKIIPMLRHNNDTNNLLTDAYIFKHE